MKAAICLCKRYIDVVKECGRAAANTKAPLLIFCEDKLSLSIEKAVVKNVPNGGTFNVSVTTFARYLSRRGKTQKSLSKEGSVMAVRKILFSRAGMLKYLKKSSANTSIAVYELIAQLKSAKITPDDLKKFCGNDPLLMSKIDDISLVYSDYEQYLSGGIFDESGYLELLPAAIQTDSTLKNTHVILAGYSSFTRQASAVIEQLIGVCPSVTGIFCGGNSEIYTNEAQAAFVRVCTEKALSCATRESACDMPFESRYIAQSLYDPAVFKASPRPLTDRVFLYEADSLPGEIKFICERIVCEVKENNARYRDISIVCGNLPNSGLLLKRYLEEYDIPFFLDENIDLASHPLPRFLITLLKTINGGFAVGDSVELVKNSVFSPDKILSDAFENYILKYENHRGFLKQEFSDLQENDLIFEVFRQKAIDLFDFDKKNNASGYCAALLKILEKLDAKNALNALSEALAKTDSAAASFNGQALSGVVSVIEEIQSVILDMPMDLEEFTEILSIGLSAKKISLIPPLSDAVFIGGFDDVKLAECEVLFCMSLTSDIPSAKPDTALISDRDISLLAGFDLAIEPKIQAVNMRRRENAGIATASFDGRLYLSYPAADDDGKPQRKSEIITYIKRMFSGGEDGLPSFSREDLEAASAHFSKYSVYRYASKIPALKNFISDAVMYKHGKKDSLDAPSAYYAALNKQDKQLADKLLYSADLAFTNRIERSRELFFKNGMLSTTLLQGYFDCPYKNFARQGIKLREREIAEMRPIDSGNFLHMLMERAEQYDLPTKKAIEDFCRRETQNLMQHPPYKAMAKNPSAFASLMRLSKEAARIIFAQNSHKEVTDFRPALKEYRFGGENTPPLLLHSGDGVYKLGGIVDRLDRADDFIRIIDYKSGKVDKNDISSGYYSGKKLQLWLYLNACRQMGKPCGGYYFDLNDDYTGEDDLSNYKMTGITLAEEDVLEKTDTRLKDGEALSVNIREAKNGLAGEILESGDFEDYLKYSMLVAGKAAEQIDGGNITPSPSGGCGGCEYRGLCGYDECFMTAREPFAASPKEIAEAAKNFIQANGGEDGKNG